MNKRTLGATALALLLFGLSMFAQEKKEMSVSLEDAIAKALKNNLDVAVEVISPGLASASVSRAKQYFSPTFQVDLSGNRMEQPSTWSLQNTGTYVTKTKGSTASLAQQIPFGGNFTASLSYDYQKNNQLFQNYNPSYTSRLNLSLTQPLLRNFGWMISRKEIVVAQNNLEVSRSQFKSVLINMVYSV